MGSFSGLYITESINIKNMEKAIMLIRQVLERNLGMKLYEYGPEMFKNKFGTFQGMKYFLGSTNRAIRFNWKQGGNSAEVFSIDVWNDDSGRKDKPTITIETAGVSLAKAIPQLADIIKNPTCATCIHLHDQEWAKRYGKVCCSIWQVCDHYINPNRKHNRKQTTYVRRPSNKACPNYEYGDDNFENRKRKLKSGEWLKENIR
jgi:hypothetical protein